MNCCRALIVNLQNVFYNSQVSVGDRQYTSLLFISTIFCPQYLTMLMTERGGAIIFCRSLAPPMTLPPDATILNYLNDREIEGAPLSFCRILASPPPMPPPATIPKYFTILMTEMRDAIIFVGFWRYSMPPPPSPDTTIFNYLNERERGAMIL